MRWTKSFLAAAALLMIVTSCSIPRLQLHDRKAPPEKPRITLVLGMRHGDYWKTVYTGAEAAARESGTTLRFLAPDDEEDLKAQAELVGQALADGTDALVLAPNDDNALEETVRKALEQVPVITIDSPVSTAKVLSHIGTDNYEAGIQAAEEMIRLLDGRPARIGLIGFVQGTPKADLRERGILDELKTHPEIRVVATVYCYSDQQLAEELTRSMIKEYGRLDGIMALNSIASLGAGEALQDMNLHNEVKLVAFDSTTQELEMLQAGVIRSTVVQNPFAMGYLGVRHAVEALKGQQVPSSVDTGSKAVRPDDMFTLENQKLLFPLLR
jgi:ribose transport system substrate-binding protein